MKWFRLLAAVLLAGLATLVQAQSSAADVPKAAQGASVAVPAVPPAAAFELEIDAPEQVRLLLTRHLELLRYRELSDLSDSELDRLLSAARTNARDLVATLGYFSPVIEIERRAAGGSSVRQLRLSVAPGEPTLVSQSRLAFRGAIAADESAHRQRQQIEDDWSLRTGMRFTQDKWDGAKQQALRQLTARRYPLGRIEDSLADIDPAQHSASLSVTLDSGPPFRLGPLQISGLQHYDQDLVARLTRLDVGSEYEEAQLVQAQLRLVDSGYFDSAVVALDTSGDPAAAPLQVQLREAPLQKVVFGIGASTDAGARVSVEHTHHKVPGIGWRAVSKLLLDRDTQSIGSELTAPPDPDNWRWVGAALLQRQRSGSFDVSSQRLRGGRSLHDERIDRNYYLQYDRAQTAATAVSAPVVADSLSANYAFTVRNFDGVPSPFDGWGLGVELGGGMTLGGQRDPYGRVLLRGLFYRPLGRSADSAAPDPRAGRIALRAQAGAVIAQAGIDLPSTQLFLAGGDNSVRGYSHRDIGVTLANGQTTAGRYLGTGSIEWQRPITLDGRLTDWETAVFIDAGAVADRPRDLRLKVGIGAGVRLKSPVGPLQVDLAYGLDVRRFRLHLNVGFTF